MRKASEYKIEIGTHIKDEKRDLVIVDRKRVESPYRKGSILKYYKYKCNKCGYDEGWMEEIHLLRDRGCPCCAGKIVVEGINDIPTTAPWMVKYFQGGYGEAKIYTYSSGQKIKPICPDCGRIKDKETTIANIYNNKSIGCSCGDGFSYPEKFMFLMLEQLNVEFITQFSPEWAEMKKYDFYFELENNKYIIETDGGLGHGKKVHSFTKRSAEETQADDDYKDEQARLHDIEVIRIDADKSELEYIRDNILNSKLYDLFDLSNIDWFKCEEFALSNRVKEACELKKKNPEYIPNDIANIMNIDSSSARNYLKKGSKIWDWINYNPKEEYMLGVRKLNKNGKPVEIFKDGISLGIFKSCMEIERQSKEIFGIKIPNQAVSRVCLGKRKQYKGFIFKFIENQIDKESA